MKIGMLTTFYPPYNFGGDGIFVYRLANTLAKAGHEVHVLYDQDAFTFLNADPPTQTVANHANIQLHPLTSGRTASLDMLLTHQAGNPVFKREAIQTILDREAFDVLHFHNVSLLGGPGVLKMGHAIKLVTLHDYWFVCATHVLWRFDQEACTRRTCLACTLHAHRPPQLWRYNGGMERAIGSVDAFIGASRFSCDKHREQGFTGNLVHIPHFLPDDELTMQAAPVDLPTQRPYFLFVGRLEKIKGVQTLIDVFQRYNLADLIIVGTGTYEAALREQAAGLAHIHFMGFCSQAELRTLYAGAVAALVSSLCYETFGWITLEAFAAHTPVIVSPMGALPEIASSGGLVFTDADNLITHMETLRTQPDVRTALGIEGKRLLDTHYTEAQHLTNYFDLIHQLQEKRAWS